MDLTLSSAMWADQAHAWSELARTLITLGEIPRATALAKDAWSKLASNALQPNTAIVQAHVAHSLDLVGLHDEALAAVQAALLQARYAGRDSVLEVIAEGVPVLAALDNGDTVWQLYQAIEEIDSWWRAP